MACWVVPLPLVLPRGLLSCCCHSAGCCLVLTTLRVVSTTRPRVCCMCICERHLTHTEGKTDGLFLFCAGLRGLELAQLGRHPQKDAPAPKLLPPALPLHPPLLALQQVPRLHADLAFILLARPAPPPIVPRSCNLCHGSFTRRRTSLPPHVFAALRLRLSCLLAVVREPGVWVARG